MQFALMKVNLGTVTWRAPDCVLRIAALEGRTQLEPQHIPPLVHIWLSGFGRMWCCRCLFCKELGGTESLQERLQSRCHSSLGILQHWEHTEELMEPSWAFTNQEINICVLSCRASVCVTLGHWLLGFYSPFILSCCSSAADAEEMKPMSLKSTAELGCKL